MFRCFSVAQASPPCCHQVFPILFSLGAEWGGSPGWGSSETGRGGCGWVSREVTGFLTPQRLCGWPGLQFLTSFQEASEAPQLLYALSLLPDPTAWRTLCAASLGAGSQPAFCSLPFSLSGGWFWTQRPERLCLTSLMAMNSSQLSGTAQVGATPTLDLAPALALLYLNKFLCRWVVPGYWFP